MTLAETQALFHEILTGAEPVARERIDACFAGTPGHPAAERVAIYADMYRWRLVQAMRETFPKLVRHLGDERFAALAWDYLRRNPSEHHDVGQVGRRLARFLRRYGVEGRLRLGMKKEDQGLRGHAWVECGGRPLNDPGELAASFIAFQSARREA